MLKNFKEIDLNYFKIFNDIMNIDHDVITKYNSINELKSELIKNLDKIVEKNTIKIYTDPIEILNKLREYNERVHVGTFVTHKNYKHQLKSIVTSNSVVYDSTEYLTVDEDGESITKTLRFVKNDDVTIKSGLFIFNPYNHTFEIVTSLIFNYDNQVQLFHRDENNLPIAVITPSDKFVYVETIRNPQYLKLLDKIEKSTESIKNFSKLKKRVKIKPVKTTTNYTELIKLVTKQQRD